MDVRLYYKGKEVALDDVRCEWFDCMGERRTGTVVDYARSEADDSVAEVEAGEGW